MPEYLHHVTQREVRSLSIFRGDEDRQSYLEFMSRETQRFRVGILAWCLMTNHLHLMVDHEHLARIEKKTGRNLQKGKPGRKPADSMK
ncbi:MAG: transposase [Thermodesulfobacteriota bacterium]